MTIKQRVLSGAVALVLALAGALAVASPASAHDAPPPCTWVSLGLYDGAGTYLGHQVWTSGSKLTMPSTTCDDIYLTHVARCDNGLDEYWQARIRFYPASGGSYVNGWSGGYGGGWQYDHHTLVIVASAVQNGTKFKVEMIGSTDSPVCMSLFY